MAAIHVEANELIARFGEMMNQIIASPPETAATIIDAVVLQFRELRIEGVRDKLRFEWGESRPHRIDKFTDLRTEDFDGWEERSFQWFGVTRELSINDDDDDTALSVFLYFAETENEEPSGGVVTRLEKLDERYRMVCADPIASRLLTSRPGRINAFASEVG